MYRVLPPFGAIRKMRRKPPGRGVSGHVNPGNSAVDNPGNRAIMNHIRESEEEKSRLREV